MFQFSGKKAGKLFLNPATGQKQRWAAGCGTERAGRPHAEGSGAGMASGP